MSGEKGFIRGEALFTGGYARSVFRTIGIAIRPFQKKLLFYLILGVLSRACFLANANIIGIWVDHMQHVSSYSHWKIAGLFSNWEASHFLLLLLACNVLGVIFGILFRTAIARIGTLSAAHLYDEVTFRVSRFPMSFFDTHPVGRILSRFSSDFIAISRTSSTGLGELLSLFFDLFLFIILGVLASPAYIPLLCVVILLNLLVYTFKKNRIRKQRREQIVARSSLLSHFAETVQGAAVIKIFHKSSSFINRLVQVLEKFLKQKNAVSFLLGNLSLQLAITNVFFTFLASLIFIYLIQIKMLSVGSVGVALTFLAMTSVTVQIIFEWLSTLEEAMTGLERMDDYLHLPLEPGAHSLEEDASPTQSPVLILHSLDLHKVPNPSSPSLVVENLNFRYHPDFPLILQNINFSLFPGEKLGIIGRTGSGKSSLIQSIFHLYPFVSGRIIIHNCEADIGQDKVLGRNYISLEKFRSFVAYITQEPCLFTGTLRENLIMNERIYDKEILYYAEKIGWNSLFHEGTVNLDMPVLEKGTNFSSGERQMICLLRCLLKKSPVVVMDEATSAMDPASEERWEMASAQLLQDRTKIIIAHRLSTVEKCDKILWINAGKMVMLDTPSKVLPLFRNGKF